MKFAAPIVFLLATSAALSGCGPSGGDENATDQKPVERGQSAPMESDVAGDPAIQPETNDGATAASVDCSQLQTAPLTPEANRSETGARAVLLEWASALENKRFDRAWCQFADGGRASGMSLKQFTAQWAKFEKLTVAVPGGSMERAAGTSYYTAPATITAEGKDRTETVFAGDVVLSRVNDVPGAAPADLRWSIRSADLARQ